MADIRGPALGEQSSVELNEMENETPLFRTDCKECQFCDGLRDMPDLVAEPPIKVTALLKSLSFLDRYLAIWILLAMTIGILIGVYDAPGVHKSFNGAQWKGVSIPVLVGLLIMMWPVLTKIQYESLTALFVSREIWIHLGISFVLNWIVSPFVMFGLAWATLPEAVLERERKGVILVGIARCIAMVLIWTGLAKGDMEFCAVLVAMNSLLQIVLMSPYALLLLNVLGSNPGSKSPALNLNYPQTSTSVGIYLGIPLAAGVVTRFSMKRVLSPRAFQAFLKGFGPVALLGLLYTVIVLFANQGKRIVDNPGSVFRIFVPLILYFVFIWTGVFIGLNFMSRKYFPSVLGGYDRTVVQAFTAGSNNFELAIAIAIANFGTESPEALAATIGPLVEVPVLLGLSYVALWLRPRLQWPGDISLA